VNFISQIVGQIDSAVLSTASQFYQNTASSVLSLYTALLGLLFAFLGVMVALNVYAIAMRDAFQIGLRIVLVFAFGLSWPNFSILYDALTNTSQNLALGYFTIGGAGLPAQPDVAMDRFAADMANVVDTVTRAMGSITRGLIGALLYGVLAVLMAAYVLIVAFSKIMLAFLLGLAPMAMMATIFERTKFLFESWLSSFIGYLLYPVAAAGIIGTVINVANNYTMTNPSGSTLGSILGFIVMIIVGIFALKSIPQAVANITGQFNLASVTPQALRAVSSPAAFAQGWASPRARNLSSGFVHGATESLAKHNIARTYADKGSAVRKFSGETTRKIQMYLSRKTPL
jgi:type IV secretion system protein VirB6